MMTAARSSERSLTEALYGRITGNYRVIDALATLAFDFPPGRKDRSAFFASELEAFFVWCAREGHDPQNVKGSYAGAIGWPQFLPSSINRFAVDMDGDGRIDLQRSTADTSVAHYMAAFGWERGLATHHAVLPPTDMAQRALLLAPDIVPRFSAAQMAEQGAVLDDAGRAQAGLLALVELHNGDAAPSFVAGTQNFYVVTRYNWSSYYATVTALRLFRRADHHDCRSFCGQRHCGAARHRLVSQRTRDPEIAQRWRWPRSRPGASSVRGEEYAGVVGGVGERRRAPQESLLRRAFDEGWPAVCESVPRRVKREAEAYQRCGEVRYGFVEVACEDCTQSRLVPFCCKGRGCPSCTNRRAVETGVRLAALLPHVGHRQWTLSLPFALRFQVVKQPQLLKRLEVRLVRAMWRWQRHEARRAGVTAPLRGGAVVFTQWFGSMLQLTPHLHVLVPEAQWRLGEAGEAVVAPPPTDEDVAAVLARVLRQAKKDFAEADAAWPEDEYEKGQRESLQRPLGLELPPTARRRRVAVAHGFSLHADTAVHGNDRQGLERLCRYGARGPVAVLEAASAGGWPVRVPAEEGRHLRRHGSAVGATAGVAGATCKSLPLAG